jgi:hypothetical protein
MTSNDSQKRLRSCLWFDDPGNPKMTPLYLERYGLRQSLSAGACMELGLEDRDAVSRHESPRHSQ